MDSKQEVEIFHPTLLIIMTKKVFRFHYLQINQKNLIIKSIYNKKDSEELPNDYKSTVK